MSDCAVGPDGKLFDAKDIVWFEDADSLEPINHAITPSSSTAPSTSATIHPFFRGGSAHAPAAVVAGACRSGRAIRPSIKITDPDCYTSRFILSPRASLMLLTYLICTTGLFLPSTGLTLDFAAI